MFDPLQGNFVERNLGLYPANALCLQCLDDGEEEEEEEEDEEDEEEEETESKTVSTARPRRMSELNIPNKTKPIPEGSSLFVFSQTNK